jgi:hypothetical protein
VVTTTPGTSTTARWRRRTCGGSATLIYDDRGSLAETAARRTCSFGIHRSGVHAKLCIVTMIHSRGKHGALRLDKAPVNSESGDGRNDQHGHRGGGAVWPGDGSTSVNLWQQQPRNTCTCACTIYIQYIRRESKHATVACKPVCGQITYAQVTSWLDIIAWPIDGPMLISRPMQATGFDRPEVIFCATPANNSKS